MFGESDTTDVAKIVEQRNKFTTVRHNLGSPIREGSVDDMDRDSKTEWNLMVAEVRSDYINECLDLAKRCKFMGEMIVVQSDSGNEYFLKMGVNTTGSGKLTSEHLLHIMSGVYKTRAVNAMGILYDEPNGLDQWKIEKIGATKKGLTGIEFFDSVARKMTPAANYLRLLFDNDFRVEEASDEARGQRREVLYSIKPKKKQA